MLPAGDGAADARARSLLLAHLTAEQRRDFESTGTFAVHTSGAVWAWCVWKTLLAQAALAGVLVLPVLQLGGRELALALLLGVSATLLYRWRTGLRLAFSRRRTWRIEPVRAPVLEVEREELTFCVRIEDDALPGADRMLAYKNILEANERYFLRRANALL